MWDEADGASSEAAGRERKVGGAIAMRYSRIG